MKKKDSEDIYIIEFEGDTKNKIISNIAKMKCEKYIVIIKNITPILVPSAKEWGEENKTK
jgi:hypothetical protein